METMDRMVSINVGTAGVDDFELVHQNFSSIARSMGADRYVTVTATPLNGDDEEILDENQGCPGEHLHHDDNTMMKVREAMARRGLTENAITDMITELQNAGILFRERA